MIRVRTLIVAGIVTLASAPAVAVDISGAGATFPYPVYAKWADAYKKATGARVHYQSIGSGGGIKQIYARTVTFGASDAPLTGADLEKRGIAQFPMVMGGIVPVMNVPGIKPGSLVIDGPTLARIFLGEIKTWDDPAIAKLNPSAKLPKQAIAVVHRSDGSGTTFNFVYYLSDVSPAWKSKVGANTSVQWPVGTGAKGNEGVANNVANTQGSIGYVEYAYALQNKLSYARMVNKAGKGWYCRRQKRSRPPRLTLTGSRSRVTACCWRTSPAMRRGRSLRRLGILIYKQPKDVDATREALKFFAWAYANGGKMADELHYVPMPANVVKDIQNMWATSRT